MALRHSIGSISEHRPVLREIEREGGLIQTASGRGWVLGWPETKLQDERPRPRGGRLSCG